MRNSLSKRTEVGSVQLYPEPAPTRPEPEGRSLPDIVAIVRRHWIMVTLSTVVALGLAGVYVVRAAPVYEATTTLRLDDNVSNVAEVRQSIEQKELPTEMEELRSRSMAEAVTEQLKLQVRLTRPFGVRRDDLFTNIRVADDIVFARYKMVRRDRSGFDIIQQDSGRWVGRVSAGERVNLPGASFVLSARAVEYPSLRFSVSSFAGAVGGVGEALKVSQMNREARMIMVSYRDTDPGLTWQVPATLVSRFISRRQEVRSFQATNAAAFLRQQLDTITRQLAQSEDAVRDYRERNQVVNPTAEATGQVNRMVQMQAERSLLDAERSALAKLLTSMDEKARTQSPDAPSPYSRVVAFPTLLKNRAATELLQSLATIQDQRRALLARRTPEDADVQALTSRIDELEEQIRGIATTYLDGLTNQVTSIDTGMVQLQRQLAAIPEKELKVTRLARRPNVLENIASLLQTRLKEAEIEAASKDGSVRVIDAAIAPTDPVSPKTVPLLFAGFVGGLLLGIGGAVAREYLDRSVHSRDDVLTATGLPVMGLIPKLGRSDQAITTIAKVTQSRLLRPPRPPTPDPVAETEPTARPAPLPPVSERPIIDSTLNYTFLRTPTVTPAPGPAPEPTPPPAPARDGAVIRDIVMEICATGSIAAEAYDMLQTNISFARSDRQLKVLVFTSALPGEGKTTTTVNLAFTLAHRGLDVLLIDADIRRGTVHTVFDHPQTPGLTEVLTGGSKFEDAIRRVRVGEHRSLAYVASGRPVLNPSGLMESPSMEQVVAEARRQFGVVLIDSSPVNVVTDASLLSRLSDGVILVARAGVTDSAALAHAVEQLSHVRAPVLGVVLNDINFNRDAAYDRAYRYYARHPYASA